MKKRIQRAPCLGAFEVSEFYLNDATRVEGGRKAYLSRLERYEKIVRLSLVAALAIYIANVAIILNGGF